VALGTWSTHQLTEFLAAVSASGDEHAATIEAIERAAEALEAELGAVVRAGSVVASVGFPRGRVPAAQLVELAAAGAVDGLELPGIGTCSTAVVALDDDPSGRLVLARMSGEPFGPEDLGLLRGMSRVLTLTLQLLRVLGDERTLREQSERQAAEKARLLASLQERQQLLEQLSQLQRCISERTPLDRVLAAVVDGARALAGTQLALLRLIDPSQPSELITAAVSGEEADLLRRARRTPEARGAAWSDVAEGRVAVVADEPEDAGMAADLLEAGVRTALAVPLHEHGVVVGALVVGSTDVAHVFPSSQREMLVSFAEQASVALAAAKTANSIRHAFNDSLTGLPNRALLLDRLELALGRAEREEQPVSVLFLDLDGFKVVNDSLGHVAGDRLLIDVARRLSGCLRRGDTAARIGGDEFAILLGDIGDPDRAPHVAKRVIAALGEPFTVLGREVFISASIGIAYGQSDAESLLRNADVAMYRAKRSGDAGAYAIFEPGMHAAVVERLEVEADLRRAIERNELVLHYQPLIELAGGRVVGLEALLRWAHPRRGLVMPFEFIPLAEETRLIVELGRWALREACRQAAQWRDDPETGRPWVSVNLSGLQLLDDSLDAEVAAALADSGLDPAGLTLEITETVLVQDVAAAVERLDNLRALGVSIAIDDFGTGYSSLRYIRRFPADMLKIAKPFVDGLHDETDAALVRTIIALADSLGLRTVAEGIEDAEQLARLRDLGCTLGQGYLFARPLAPEDATALLGGALAHAA
jgi:diguanylate cyclase (GGDEF)-like protein